MPEAEIVNAFVKHEPAKGTEATTLNMTIKSLTGSVPPPATSITYDAIYTGPVPDSTSFVRAYLDFAGQVYFEYGHTELLGTTNRYAYDGPTQGKLFTGDNGVVQVVIPAEAGGKAGSKLNGITAETQVGRSTFVPGAVNQSPTRGLSFENDTAAIGTWTVEPCGAAAPSPAPGEPGPTPGPTQPSAQSDAPRIKLLTTKLKKAGKGKKVALKFSTSAPLTKIALRLSKGKAVYGTAKAPKLAGTKKLVLKLKRKLGKGTYQLAFAGTDSSGARRVGSFKVKVK